MKASNMTSFVCWYRIVGIMYCFKISIRMLPWCKGLFRTPLGSSKYRYLYRFGPRPPLLNEGGICGVTKYNRNHTIRIKVSQSQLLLRRLSPVGTLVMNPWIYLLSIRLMAAQGLNGFLYSPWRVLLIWYGFVCIGLHVLKDLGFSLHLLSV